MDLSYSPEQESFRDELRAWLGANVPHDLPSMDSPEGFAARREWERALHAAGYVGLHWPAEYGGRGADVVHQAIFEEEYFLAGGPERITALGENLMGPTLMVYGTPEQRDRWLPRILSADDLWSQGFSEPEAGSDLAGLRTRAVSDGDDFVVNGQKIWTSYGSFADWIFALVRTDPDAERHAGITFLALDMRSDGVEARPIVQLDGHAGFAEVFFTDVRVPAANVVGEVNRGWEVAMTTLGFEREAPAAPAARFQKGVRDLLTIARATGRDRDPVARDRIAELHVRAESYRLHGLRTLTRLQKGETIGSEASVTKLLWSELGRDITEAGLELLGPDGERIEGDDPVDRDRWHRWYWLARASTLYAGTSEIQRNIIGERVLGLPRS